MPKRGKQGAKSVEGKGSNTYSQPEKARKESKKEEGGVKGDPNPRGKQKRKTCVHPDLSLFAA